MTGEESLAGLGSGRWARCSVAEDRREIGEGKLLRTLPVVASVSPVTVEAEGENGLRPTVKKGRSYAGATVSNNNNSLRTRSAFEPD